MPTLVLTLLGTDHAGMVAAVSRLISARGGSWERSQMAHLAGTFAGIVERSDEPASSPGPEHRLTLNLVGADHPGIVAEVSNLLAEHRVNVEELSTRVVDAPMAGGYLFEAEIVVSVPGSTDQAELRGALEALADELMVDVELHDTD